MTVEIRALSSKDDRSKFNCGNEALDLYFHKFAGQHQFRHHIGVTYVAVNGSQIVGFVTVSPATLDADTIDGKRLPPFPIPVLRVARLGVERQFQGQGVGKELLKFCLDLADQMQTEFGCTGVLIDAKANSVAFYSRLGFKKLVALQGEGSWRPKTTPMYISLGSIPKKRKAK